MGHERLRTEAGHELLARSRWTGERLGLLLAVLVSGLLAASRPIGAGEGPIPIVEVKLTEFAIEMPTTIPPGPAVFSVTNAGTEEHNFAIEGQGVEKRFDANLKPGETRSLQVDLPVGTYTVYSPVEDHKERRMRLELKVAQQRSDGATATSRGFRQALAPALR